MTSGVGNIGIGVLAGQRLQTGSFNIYIGAEAIQSESNIVRIGDFLHRFYTPGVFNTPVSGSQLLIAANGLLGIATSSRRFKEDIRDMGDATRGLYRLRPVTFHYKQSDQSGARELQYGLIAEDVAEVYPELVEYSDGQPFTVRYHLLGAMLLNEVQRQERQIREQQEKLDTQASQIADLQADRELRDLEQRKQAAQIIRLEGRLAAIVRQTQAVGAAAAERQRLEQIVF